MMKGISAIGSLASKLTVGLAMAAISLLGAAGVQADPIGPTGCTNNSCNGGIYTLTYSGSPIINDGTNSTYRVTLTMDTTDSNFLASIAAVDAVGVKVSSTSLSASLFAAPGGTAGWIVIPAGVNANGCAGAGGGFWCAGKSGGVAIADTMAWTFDIVIANSVGLNTTPSIKARFIDSSGRKVGAVLSEDIQLQTRTPGGGTAPIPSSLLLLGSGIGVLAAFRRNKR